MDELIAIAWLLLALTSVSVIGAPMFMWFTTWPKAQARWFSRLVETESVPYGQIRDAAVPRVPGDGPPMSVRLASLGSWILGSLFVPGLLLCGVLLLFMGVGVLVIPALILGWRLFFLGRPLLMGEPASVRKARRLARFACLLNGVTLAAAVWGIASDVPGLIRVGAYGRLNGAWSFAVLQLAVALHAGVSLFHAALLIPAAKAIEALRANDVTTLRGPPAVVPTEGAGRR